MLGSIPVVRYPEALFALGVVAFLVLCWRSQSRVPLHYAAALGGALIPLIPLMAYHQFAFGAVWRTAYSLTNEQTGFGWSYFREHFARYIHQMHGQGIGLFFPFGLVGMVLLCGERRRRALGWLLVLVAAPVTLLYMAYYWAPQRAMAGTMRFVLPTFVCYILAGLWAVAACAARLSAAGRRVLVALLLVVQGIWSGAAGLADARTTHSRRALVVLTDALEQHTQQGDVVMANRQVLQHLDFVHKWRLVDLDLLWGRGGGRRGPGRRNRDPDAPAPMQAEKQTLEAEKYGGFGAFRRERAVAWDVRDWARGAEVYLLGGDEEIERLRGFYFGQATLEVVSRVALPAAPEPAHTPSLMGPGPAPGMPAPPPSRGPPRAPCQPR